MINSNVHVKVVLSIRERMDKINKSYKNGGTVGMWLPIWIFGIEVFYWISKLLTSSAGYIWILAGIENVNAGKLQYVFDFIPFFAPIVFSVISYFAFGARSISAQYVLLIFNGCFLIASAMGIILDFNRTVYIACAAYSAFLFAISLSCLKAYKDEQLLKKIDGYPHFNPVLMEDEKVEKSQIRFRQTKTDEQLYEERMREYAESNPDTETGRLYAQRKDEENSEKIDDWLDEMLRKN